MKIWSAKPPRLAPVPTTAAPPQSGLTAPVPGRTTRAARILTDTITRDVVPAASRAFISITERRRLEDEYVGAKWDKLKRGSHYSAGPHSSSGEVMPGKIDSIANELAVIKEEREEKR